MGRFGETRKRKGQDESDTGDKKQSRRCSSKWLVFFEKNFKKIAKSTNASSAKSGNPSLSTTAGLDLGFAAAKTVK